MPSTRDQMTFKVRVLEQTGQYEDMWQVMQKVISDNPELSIDELKMYSSAFKGVVTPKRSAWRQLEHMIDGIEDEANKKWVKKYQEKLQDELCGIWNGALSVLENTLLPGAKSTEAKVFIYKLTADCHQHKADVTKDEDGKLKAEKVYMQAYDLSDELPPLHPLKLQLAFHFAVFFCDMMKDPEKGCKIASDAYRAATRGPPHGPPNVSPREKRIVSKYLGLLREVADAACGMSDEPFFMRDQWRSPMRSPRGASPGPAPGNWGPGPGHAPTHGPRPIPTGSFGMATPPPRMGFNNMGGMPQGGSPRGRGGWGGF